MHNESFAHYDLDYVYLAFDVPPERFEQAVDGLVAVNARGWNCTMPHKRRMFERADVLSEEAQLIGAVNTVVQKDGILTGYNTDGKGYMKAVRDAGHHISGKKMTLFRSRRCGIFYSGAGGLRRGGLHRSDCQKRGFLGRHTKGCRPGEQPDRLHSTDV